MKISLFLVHRIDGSAVRPLALIIYSYVTAHRAVTRVRISERDVQFVRPLLMKNYRISLSDSGLECRDGVVYAVASPGPHSAEVPSGAPRYQAISEALNHLSRGFLTETVV